MYMGWIFESSELYIWVCDKDIQGNQVSKYLKSNFNCILYAIKILKNVAGDICKN